MRLHTRRTALSTFLAVPALLLAGCAVPGAAGAPAEALAPTAALPSSVPDQTEIVVGDPATEVALKLSGELGKFTFPIKFAELSGGPQTIEAFRAGALDVGSVADIPPLHATWTGLDVRIVASSGRREPLKHPIYRLGVAPGSGVSSLADLRGKKIAYSPGQAQGALVLRVLAKAGLTQNDVKLVELPSTGDVYANALGSRQVDVAPISGALIKRYLSQYGAEGGTTLAHGLRDDPWLLYVPEASLRDPAKAAAIREYVQRWAVAKRWVNEHPVEWAQKYYVEDQGLSPEDAAWVVEQDGKTDVPTSWDQAIADHQATVDLLAAEQGREPFDVDGIYDRRFEKIAGAFFRGREST